MRALHFGGWGCSVAIRGAFLTLVAGRECVGCLEAANAEGRLATRPFTSRRFIFGFGPPWDFLSLCLVNRFARAVVPLPCPHRPNGWAPLSSAPHAALGFRGAGPRQQIVFGHSKRPRAPTALADGKPGQR